MSILGKISEIKGDAGFIRGQGSLKKHRSTFIYWLVVFGVFSLDWISKFVVTHTMELHQSISIIGDIFKFTYVRNSGAAFSLLANQDTIWRLVLFIGIGILAFIIITVMAFLERKRNYFLLIPFGLVSGGDLGNLYDRITSGAVIDFIEVSYKSFHYPIFNFADSAVVIGVFWLLFSSFRKQSKKTLST